MELALTETLRSIGGLVVGGLIGVCFGFAQEVAWRRNKKRQDAGSLDTGWAVMPGSMRRVAYLLIALVAVQMICPMFFVNGTEWWVSGGVVAGYGVMLYQQMRRRRSELP